MSDAEREVVARSLVDHSRVEAQAKIRTRTSGYCFAKAATIVANEVSSAGGTETRRSNGLVSATQNYVPVTLVDVSLEPGGVFEQELPASYNGFLLPITGAVLVDGEKAPLARGEMGWFGRADEEPLWLRLTADEEPARVLLYAGARQGEPTVHYGPFVAGSMAGIEGMYRDYRRGRFPKSSEL